MDLEKFIQNNTPKKKISIFDEYVEDINKIINNTKYKLIYIKLKCIMLNIIVIILNKD